MSQIDNPLRLFEQWLERARQTGLPQPTAMTLATLGPDGEPSARMVLLKGCDTRGFVFYTNLQSRKARDLQARPRAALCFHWPSPDGASQPDRQVRIEGTVEQVSDVEADAYFASRPRGAQIAAWASQQSAVLENCEELEVRVRQCEVEFSGREVPRPDFWSGLRVVAQRMEFWESRENRLHKRTLYVQKGALWVKQKLYP